MTNQTPPSNCPSCNSPITEKSGTSRKNGKPYHFWGCSNYPQCKFTWEPERPTPQTSGGNEKVLEGLRLIYAEIKELRKEFKAFSDIFGAKQE